MALTEKQKENIKNGGPKKVTGGNSRCDQEWIAAMLEDGSLHWVEKENIPKDFYYDVLLQWDDLNEDLNDEFFEFYRPPRKGPRRCNGVAYVRDQRGGYVVDREWQRLKRKCIATPGVGATVCHAHGSQIPVVKAAAQQRLAEAAEIVAMRLIGLTAQADEKEEAIAHKDRIAAINSVLDRSGIKGGVEVEVSAPGFKRVLSKMFSEGEEATEDEE